MYLKKFALENFRKFRSKNNEIDFVDAKSSLQLSIIIVNVNVSFGRFGVRRHFNIGMNDILFLPFLMPKTTHVSLHDTLLAVKRQFLVVL